MASLLYMGHGSLRLTTASGKVVYIDPFMGADELYAAPADLVLVTHQHYDHNQTDKMPHAPGCALWQNTDAHPTSTTYLTKSFLNGELSAEAVEAYNSHHSKDECVGYVLEVDGLRLYFAGDTSETAQMHADLRLRALDWAFLPGDGFYTMNVDEAAKVANYLGAQCHAVPIHLKPGGDYDEAKARRFARLASNHVLVRPGETIELTRR